MAVCERHDCPFPASGTVKSPEELAEGGKLEVLSRIEDAGRYEVRYTAICKTCRRQVGVVYSATERSGTYYYGLLPK